MISKDIAVQWSNTNVKLAFCDDHLLAKAEAAADELAAKGHSYIKFINLGEHTPHPTPRLIGNYLDLINAVSRVCNGAEMQLVLILFSLTYRKW